MFGLKSLLSPSFLRATCPASINSLSGIRVFHACAVSKQNVRMPSFQESKEHGAIHHIEDELFLNDGWSSADFGNMNESWEARDRFQKRTHRCGVIDYKQVGSVVTLCGWVERVHRLSDKLKFLSLRDGHGITQLVLNEEVSSKVLDLADKVSSESVICISGKVCLQPESSNKVEVLVNELNILSTPNFLAFTPGDLHLLPKEETRLKARYLDLRRLHMQSNLVTRAKCARIIRNFLEDKGFLEVETPLLFKPTPEGAKEFIVPTRRDDHYYALPQSPQQYKQLLMASGVDRYYQIARCFRDEDLRADRQPEFTQIDMEIAYATPSLIMKLVEGLIRKLWLEIRQEELPTMAFPVLSYQEAMSRFGSDKPDMRSDHEIINLSAIIQSHLPNHQLHIFVINDNQVSMTMLKQWQATITPKFRLSRITSNNIESWLPPLPNTLGDAPWRLIIKEVNKALGNQLREGTMIGWELQPKSPFQGGWTGLGKFRLRYLKSILSSPTSSNKFLWVNQFPLLTRINPTADIDDALPDEYKEFGPVHHPFTSPVPEDLPLLFTHPENVRGEHYDLVLNGMELGGGSLRIHDPKLQEYLFRRVMKMDPSGVNRFRHLLQALGSGCPPHGGIALGFDRLVATLVQASSLREVIAFPKSSTGADLTVGSPSEILKLPKTNAKNVN